MGRRKFIAGSGAGALGLTAGCIGGAAGGDETVTMLLTPDTPSDVRPQYEPVTEMLRGEIDGLDLEVEVPQDYSAVRPALDSGQAEIGMDDVTLISAPDLMDLFGTAVSGGAAFYFSMMLTKPDSSIDERTDLEGKRVAFADRLSTSGSIFAVYALKQAGLDVGDAPDGDPVDFDGVWSNHADAVQKVINDDADACCTWTGNGMAYLPEDQELPQEVREEDSFIGNRGNADATLRPFWWSFPIPKQPIYARKDWESDMKGKIEQQLLDSDEELIREYMPDDYNESDLPFTTLSDTTMDNYQPVIKRLNDLGIELG
ncbi:ABC-type transport system periplasmic substrate-binding protein (probable substrate phosphate/phosphonate) [Natronomonas moolapensis 8.8.11]|uniref:ABC-type transport system periplasmic substrate-binding protein (Probable substrate phosphate/phosphonate) n=2 Tax=Natronomonas moolapensis TaxID=416273 RepID=M1XPU1_NATM8|nr:ABC-type transport system periplasmic substrate-binding protein (probable substrate phosphate/phosphonate) [Natronomonas moolapensis 8.8.11]